MLKHMLLPVLLLAAPALAQADDAKPKKPRKECRTTGRTGSRFTSSICHTPEEWQEIDKDTAEKASKFMGDFSSTSGRGGLNGGTLTGGPPQG